MDTDSILPFNGGCEDCPMENVSWKNAQEFIGRLNAMTGKTFRLPTEAEWEYAARGGHKSKHYKYSGSNQVSEVAWYVGNSSGGQYGEAGTTRPVGLKRSNELGLYDMSGNVGNGAVICTLKNTSKVVSLSIRDGLLRAPIFSFAGYCEVEVGEEQQRGVGCRTLITTLRIIVTSMEASAL